VTHWETGHRGGITVYIYEDDTFPSPAGRLFSVSGATDEQLDLIEVAPDALDAVRLCEGALEDMLRSTGPDLIVQDYGRLNDALLACRRVRVAVGDVGIGALLREPTITPEEGSK
jgi:hypothetical protein